MGEKKNQQGFILLIVLLFLFVLTLLGVSDSQAVVLENKMQDTLKNYFSVFTYAELGLEQAVFALQGKSITLPDSAIALAVTEKIISTDSCGNRTIDICATAKNNSATVVLNSRSIFARVPREKGCQKIPAHQIIGWKDDT